MNPLLYIPIIIVFQYFIMLISYNSNNNYTSGGYKWLFFNIALGCLASPIWAFISFYSKNMVLDSILYDITVAVSCVFFAVYFSEKFSHHLNVSEIIGIIFMVIGFLVFKFGEID